MKMKNLIVTSSLFLMILGMNAQVNTVDEELKKTEVSSDEEREDGWYKAGAFSLLLNQAAFSNWLAGGSNNVGVNAGLNYDFNYKKGDLTWDNRLTLAYGVNKLEGDDIKKTDDRIELNSIVGKKANFGKYWSYSFFLNFRTQFDDGFRYDAPNWDQFMTSGFMRPAYLTFGPGLLYKKSENFKINLAPFTSKMTYVSSRIFDYNEDSQSFTSSDYTKVFGVEPGDNLLYQFGFYASMYYKLNLMENVSMENILNLYSNYLDKPQNIDIDYTMNMVMKVNKYLSANLTFQTIYDDDAFSGFQVREVFGAGLNYNF